MGFIAITGTSDIDVENVSDCIVLGRRKSYVFLEIQLKFPETTSANSCTISIYVSGQVKQLKEGKSIMDSKFFSEWYYSQKLLKLENGGILKINGTEIQNTQPILESNFNQENNVTEIKLIISAGGDQNGCKRIVCFLTYETSQNISKTFGTLTLQSRYFDLKECPFGRFFETTVMRGKLLTPQKIYCWLIAQPAYYLVGYTNFGKLQPRDIRIIEKMYLTLIKNKYWFSRKIIALNCWIFGFPQVINWKLTEEQITFNESHRSVGKWDDIRLVATFKGYELSSAFVAISCLASILGLVLYMLEKFFPWRS